MDREMLLGMLRSGRDVASTIGSSLLAEPVAGLGGLATLATGGGTDKAAEQVRALRERLTYQPRSDEGRRSLELIAKPFEMLEESVIRPASDKAYELGGPVAGTAVNTALNMVDPFKGKGKAARNAMPKGIGYDEGLAMLKQQLEAEQAAARPKAKPAVENIDMDWGGPREGGLFNFNDPGHYDFIAEKLAENGVPESNMDIAVRHEMAKLNAAAPKEAGGLGMSYENTPQQRAAALGYDTPTYHGSLTSTIEAFDPERLNEGSFAGPGVYSSTNPLDASANYASIYGPDPSAKMGFELDDFDPEQLAARGLEKNALDEMEMSSVDKPASLDVQLKAIQAAGLGDSPGVVYPLLLRKGSMLNAAQGANPSSHLDPNDIHAYFEDMLRRGPSSWQQEHGPGAEYFKLDNPSDIEAAAVFDSLHHNPQQLIDDFELRDESFDTLAHTPKFGMPFESPEDIHYISRDPSNVRSRFAAFDPAQKKSSNILALTGASSPTARDILLRKLRETGVNALTQDEQGE